MMQNTHSLFMNFFGGDLKYQKIMIFVLLSIIGFCIVVLGVGVIFLARIPKVETQVFPGSYPVHVQLSAPVSPTGWQANSYIPIQVNAMGGGTISTIELYINGVLFEKISSPRRLGPTRILRQLAMAAWNDWYFHSPGESYKYNGSNGCFRTRQPESG